MSIKTESSEERWSPAGQIDIYGHLSISDTSYFYDEPLVVALPAGRYEIDVRFGSEDEHRYVSAIRLTNKQDNLIRAEIVGVVPVDFSQVGLCDREQMKQSLDTLGNDRMAEYFEKLNTLELTGWVELPPAGRMFYARPGFGAAHYPVFELLSSLTSERRGIEIDCEAPTPKDETEY